MRVFTMLPMRHWREAAPFGAEAEAAGFDALMTVELGHDVFTPLAVAALATERVELTPSIAVAFPRLEQPRQVFSQTAISRPTRPSMTLRPKLPAMVLKSGPRSR